MRFYTEEEIEDKYIGKKGTPQRERFEADIPSMWYLTCCKAPLNSSIISLLCLLHSSDWMIWNCSS